MRSVTALSPPPPVICSPAAVHCACYRWLWFQPIITLLLNNLKWGGGKSQRCQGRRKMDASVLSDAHRESERLETWNFAPVLVLLPVEILRVCLQPFVCVFCSQQSGSSFAFQLLADLCLCLCRRVNLWLCVSHKTMRTQTGWRRWQTGVNIYHQWQSWFLCPNRMWQ